MSDRLTTVVSEDPLRVRVTLPCAGDELRVLLDETCSAIETTLVE